MPIEKLEEFARDGQKNTDELILTDGFPRPKFPARQWFNYLFNAISLKINEIIELNPIARSEIVDNLTTDDATKVASARTVKELQDNKLESTDLKDASTTQKGVVQLDNTLTSTSTDQALTAAQGKALNDKMFGVGQTRKDVSASRLPGTTYFNATQKAFFISITIDNAATAATQRITIEAGGIKYMNDMRFDNDTLNAFAFTFPVLPGESWYYNHTGIGNRIIVEVS